MTEEKETPDTQLGLRIDVDTLKGTLEGVPRLLDALERHRVKGSFFMSVGPDNMGRHLWCMLRPAFLLKMCRSKAASLYGLDILLCGTLWPGRKIGKRSEAVIRRIHMEGHEVGLHAWDHHRWQQRIDRLSDPEVFAELERAYRCLKQILGVAPECAASPAWRCTEAALLAKESYPFRFNSDCRGDLPFYPVVDGRVLGQLQLPVNLPTYDEVVGQGGISDDNYNDYLLSRVRPGKYNVLTIHAEVEGGSRAELFEDFLQQARARGIGIVSLGALAGGWKDAPGGRLIRDKIPGREGWASYNNLL